MALELDPIEQRVIGSLLEKERTVPDTYPMTLNGLRTACNQSSGRAPVLALSEHEVQAALDRLRSAGLTRVLHASHGARVPKHRQVLDEVLTLDDGDRAVVTLLLLRGPQTPGELKGRSERLYPFGSLEDVQRTLDGLIERELVARLSRRPGQKEERFMQLLGGESVESVPAPPPAAVTTSTDPRTDPGLEERVARLEEQVAALQRRGNLSQQGSA